MKSEWREYLLGDLYNFSSGLSKNSKEFGFGKLKVSQFVGLYLII